MDKDKLSPTDWLNTIERDYLRTYVLAGGSTVKVVVANTVDREITRAALEQRAKSTGYRYAHVDSGTRRVHLVHQVFWEIARQIPWQIVAQNVLRKTLQGDSRVTPHNGDLSIAALAEANDQTEDELIRALRRLVSNRVYKDYALSREFRSAAAALCHAVYDQSADVQQLAADVRAWLDGTLERVGAVRRSGLFRKIGRSNARQLLYSATSWLRTSGDPGIVITVDVARYILGKDAPLGSFPAYTKLAALDFNEVLRQFIDAADDLHGAVIIFLTDDKFLTDHTRGLGGYEALRLRLTDNVRDRERPNPLAPMVLLETGS